MVLFCESESVKSDVLVDVHDLESNPKIQINIYSDKLVNLQVNHYCLIFRLHSSLVFTNGSLNNRFWFTRDS